ncbi:hypothetical protein UA08_00075 [Talaromyces atroroseus]|uniref:Uncharacterized protein n=1 Tax=Talaromyces atroroseus TaxID=1441469 RepID=A0A225ARN0_TALAT|nr:hypothetical protein UA08_00075 [Talaromyces atroroseus]OKL63650.1 hypothetical protein UA08_00075 [Talaromyces atroroseus]
MQRSFAPHKPDPWKSQHENGKYLPLCMRYDLLDSQWQRRGATYTYLVKAAWGVRRRVKFTANDVNTSEAYFKEWQVPSPETRPLFEIIFGDVPAQALPDESNITDSTPLPDFGEGWRVGVIFKTVRSLLSAPMDKVNAPVLLAQASSLRGGLRCTTPTALQYDRSQRSTVMGGMNYHIEIQFEDGVSWLARIRRVNVTSPPPNLRAHIMRSEIATLQFLRKTNVPAPKVLVMTLMKETQLASHIP